MCLERIHINLAVVGQDRDTETNQRIRKCPLGLNMWTIKALLVKYIMSITKTFDLLNPKTGEILASYQNKQPRKAALKAAGAGHTEILLRQAGSAKKNRVAKIHEFKGSKVLEEFPLPYPGWVKATIEKKAGKPIPPELNKVGKEAELKALGFEPHKYSDGRVKKVAMHNIPKVGGGGLQESIGAWIESRSKP